jgi:hypothetical protein
MDVIYPRCCGLDVHKSSITACVLTAEDKTRKRVQRRFGTVTAEIVELASWLKEFGVTHVAMESTGVYWKPIWNLLEGHFELVLVNAAHIKNVPGRKTDMKDCDWIAQLLQHGLLRGSFVPERSIRELRDLNRQRVALIGERNRVANRVQKVLEDANIKLASVASDTLGLSGRTMLEALIAGEQDAERMAAMARGLLKRKADALRLALAGNVNDPPPFADGMRRPLNLGQVRLWKRKPHDSQRKQHRNEQRIRSRPSARRAVNDRHRSRRSSQPLLHSHQGRRCSSGGSLAKYSSSISCSVCILSGHTNRFGSRNPFPLGEFVVGRYGT